MPASFTTAAQRRVSAAMREASSRGSRGMGVAPCLAKLSCTSDDVTAWRTAFESRSLAKPAGATTNTLGAASKPGMVSDSAGISGAFGRRCALVVPAINPKAAYDPVRQFAPIGGVCSLPLALVSSSSFPAGNVQELIAVLKASPGKYSYASPGVGTLQHLAFELFMHTAGVQAVHVPYKGATAMMPDLMSGQVPIGIVSALAGVSQAKSGKIRALAVTSAQRLPNAPEIPALSETIPGFEAAPNVFLVAPAGFASERLAGAVRQVVTSPEVQDSFAKQGATPMPLEPRELASSIAAEVRRWAAVVKDAGIKAE